MKLTFVTALLLCALGAEATGHLRLRGDDRALANNNVKVDICHIPPGNPGNFHTITVSENAVQAHLDHGDSLGSCDEFCGVLCDDGDACTIDYDKEGCESGGCYDAPRPPVNCDDQNACTVDTCDPVNGCEYADKDCDDGNECTTDSCDSTMGCMHAAVACDDDNLCTTDTCDATSGCVFTPVQCESGKVCDQTTGQCTAIEEVVPCVAVIDEWSYNQATVDQWWIGFRATYPKRPFCLLTPLPQSGNRFLHADYEADGLSPDGVDRTIYAEVNRDGGNDATKSDWFTICSLSQYTSGTSTIGFVGLFVDGSGSMTKNTVLASYNEFNSDIAKAGLTVREVYNGAENWVVPFMGPLAP